MSTQVPYNIHDYLVEFKWVNTLLGDPLKTGIVEIKSILGILFAIYLIIYLIFKWKNKNKNAQTFAELTYEFFSEPFKGSMKISAFLIQGVVSAHYKSGLVEIIRKHLLNILGAIVFTFIMYVIVVTVVILSAGVNLEIFDKFVSGDWNERVGMIFNFFNNNVYANFTLITLYVLLTVEYAKTNYLEKKYWHFKRSGMLLSVPLGEWDETPKLNIPEDKLIKNARDVVRSFLSTKDVDQIRVKAASGYDLFGEHGYLVDLLKKPNVTWKILLMNPAGDGVKIRHDGYNKERASDPPADLKQKHYSQTITEVIDTIKDIKKNCNANIEVRVYDHIPQWRMFICSGVAIVGSFGPGQRSDRVPLYLFENSNTSMFHGYEEMFEDIWHNSSKQVV